MAASAIALLGAAAAWSAIVVNRNISKRSLATQINTAARSSRANVVSANRQRWIDAIREDVSEFIAIRLQIFSLKAAGSFQGAGQDALLTEERSLKSKVIMLMAKIDLRLNHLEEDHLALLRALSEFNESPDQDSDKRLREIARKIFKEEWARLKREASGVGPHVQETGELRRF